MWLVHRILRLLRSAHSSATTPIKADLARISPMTTNTANVPRTTQEWLKTQVSAGNKIKSNY
jgi:hypothetical protein